MGGEGSVARRVLFFCSWCPFVLSFSYARAARRPSPPRVPARVSLTVNKCALPPSCPLRRPALVASSRARLPARLLWRHNVHVGCIPFAYGVAGSDRAGVAERAGVDTWSRWCAAPLRRGGLCLFLFLLWEWRMAPIHGTVVVHAAHATSHYQLESPPTGAARDEDRSG